jgi:AcrR family transcriptional regulator
MDESHVAQENGALSKRAVARHEKILDAALAVILRYGFDRCTMQDIAAESGITRAALYKYFRSKDEVLHALVTKINAEANDDALRESRSEKPFRERLRAVIDARLGRIQRILSQGGHGAEISDATHRIGGQLTVAADKAYLDLVTAMFAEAARCGEIDTSRTGLSLERYAELCVFAAKGLMREAGDIDYRADYAAAISDLSDVICAALDAKDAAPGRRAGVRRRSKAPRDSRA